MKVLRPRHAQLALFIAMILRACIFAGAQQKPVPALVTQSVNNDNRITLRGNMPPLARAEFDRGAAPDGLPMRRMLLLLKRSREQELALARLLEDQQIKSSPNFHRWLTPEEFGERFGPAEEDVRAVGDWLVSQGFTVNKVSAGRTVIEFSGTADRVREGLRTEIHKFVVNHQEHWANSGDPQIPAALAPVVAGVVSLNNFPRTPMHRSVGRFRRSKATGEVEPLFTYTSGTATFYALGPTDFATIYNLLPLWDAGIDGTGQTVAIVGDSNIKPYNVDQFRSMFGLPPNPVDIILDGPDPGRYFSHEVEADLDVQWAGAVAKGATINLVVAENTETTAGVDLAALYIIDNNIAPVLSESFGACEQQLGNAGNAFESAMWEQAAAQGITVVVSSGDSGSAGCDYPGYSDVFAAQNGLAVNGLASTPFNVAAGGTGFDNPGAYFNATNDPATAASAKSYVPETTWNESCASSGDPTDCTEPLRWDLVAGGGGPSNCAVQDSSGKCASGYPKPAWQTGTGVPADGDRNIPDVSLFAGDGQEFAFYIACWTPQGGSCNLDVPNGEYIGVSGTSVSAPAFAGMMALVNQKTGQRQGNANYSLYALAAQAAQGNAYCTSGAAAVGDGSCVFYDVVKGQSGTGAVVTPGNNAVVCAGGSPACSSTVAGVFGIMGDPNSPSTPAWTTDQGYDRATGLGSVNAAHLVNNWGSVSFRPSATTLNLNPTTLTHGQSVNANVQVTSAGGTPSGEVALMGDPATNANPGGGKNVGIAAFTLDSSGAASGTTNMLPGGTYDVFARYAGDGTFGSSDSTPPVTVTVNPESSATELRIATWDAAAGRVNYGTTSLDYGSPYLLRVDVRNSAGALCAPMNASGTQTVPASGCPTGTVTWTDNGAPPPAYQNPFAPPAATPGTLVLNSQGYAEDQFVQLSGGTHTLVATYSGDNSFSPSASDALNVTVAKVSTLTKIYADTTTVAGEEPFWVIVDVNGTGQGDSPTGTVQIFDGSSPVTEPTNCRISGIARCEAYVNVTLTAHANLVAKYPGDQNYSGSTSAPTAFKVKPYFHLSSHPAGLWAAAGSSANYTISATGYEGFSGKVQFTCVVSTAISLTGYMPTCSFNPSSVSLGSSPSSTTLIVGTTGPAMMAPPGGQSRRLPLFPPAVGLVMTILAGSVFTLLARRPQPAPAACAGLVFLALVALATCGGETRDPRRRTPAGDYTITVTGTSGALSRTTQVTLTVH